MGANIRPVDLVPTGVTAGTYGTATDIPQFTVNAQGQVTSATTVQATESLAVKSPVRLATAAALPAYTFAANVITVTATGTLTVDGVLTALNDRILLKNGAAGADNGIYTVTTAGAVGVQAVLTRATDMNASAECVSGMLVPVGPEGTLNANALFQLETAAPITLNTTSLTFGQTNPVLSGVAPQLTVGNAVSGSAANGEIDFKGSTSGTAKLTVGAAAGTPTLTLGTTTGTILATADAPTVTGAWTFTAATPAISITGTGPQLSLGTTSVGGGLRMHDASATAASFAIVTAPVTIAAGAARTYALPDLTPTSGTILVDGMATAAVTGAWTFTAAAPQITLGATGSSGGLVLKDTVAGATTVTLSGLTAGPGILAVGTAPQIKVGSSTAAGGISFGDGSSANTGGFVAATYTGNQLYTLPNVTGTVQLAPSVQASAGGVANAAGAGDTVLFAFTIPGSTLNVTGRTIRIRAWGTTAATANNKTIKLFFNANTATPGQAVATGTAVWTSGVTTANAKNWQCEALISRTGASTQQAFGSGFVDLTYTAPLNQSAAVTDTAAIIVAVTGSSALANEILGFYFSVEVLG